MMPFSQDDLYLTYAREAQLDFTPSFLKLAYDQFEGRIRIHSATNTRGTTSIDPAKSQRRSKGLGPITESQLRRGAEGSFKWVTTLYPTDGYAQDAGMSLKDYEDFVFRAIHAEEADPIKYWQNSGVCSKSDRLAGRKPVICGPNVDLSLSIKL
jgi:aminopeptidase